MTRAWLILLVACGDNRTVPDAALPIDARSIDTPPPVCEVFELASCTNGTAKLELVAFDGCAAPVVREHACGACAIDFARVNLGARTMFSLEPVIFCAETPSVSLNAPCGPTLCLPTRAAIAGDGTVTGQQYIACGEEFCIPRLPPMIPDYGAACTTTTYDERDPSRSACLAGGATRYCIGDWECPTGMLCDDEAGTPRPVCKPGPRGPAP